MNSFLHHLATVLLPLIVSNSLHMLVIKRDYFKGLKHPVSKRVFGENKTWRGFVFVPLVNGFSLQIIDVIFCLNILNPFCLGFILGLAYMVFELPNSLMKRQLGIRSGEQSNSNKILFLLIDKTDSALGVNLIYFLLGYVSYQYAIILFGCSSLMHILISKIMVQFKLKKSF